MTGRKRFALFLVVAGVLLLGTAGFFWRGTAGLISEAETRTTALQDSMERAHTQLEQTNLKFRGFRESQSAAPDSVRRYGGVQINEMTQSYNKQIRKLENAERDLKLEIAAIKREVAEERERAKARALPVAGAGILALVAGAIMALASRRVGA